MTSANRRRSTAGCGLGWMAALTLTCAAQLSPGSTNQADLPTLEWERVLKVVLAENPSLQAARVNWEAMKARVPQARAWEDLRLGTDFERSETTQFSTFTDVEWMVSQSLPLTGKNRLGGRAASADASAAWQDLRRRELDLVVKARTAYLRLANAHEQLEINRRNQELLQQWTQLTRAKYEVGKQTQGDLLMAQTEVARLNEAQLDIEQRRSEAQTQLNVLMNRPAGEGVGRPSRLVFQAAVLSADQILQYALEHRPELWIAQKREEAAQARLDLARRRWMPDPEVRVEARQFNGQGGDFQEYDTGLFITVPWLNRKKYRAGVEEARLLRAGAALERESIEKETSGLVRDHLRKIATLQHHSELFRDRIVPLAQQAVKATQVAYETEKAGFLDLLVAQRTALEVESTYWDYVTDYGVALAELDAMSGHSP